MEVQANIFQEDDLEENPKVIGFNRLRGKKYDFLIRKPIDQIIVYKDRRKINRGAICETYTSGQRAQFARMLGINVKRKYDTCQEIQRELFRLEVKTRQAGKGYRYYYMAGFDILPYI